MASASPVPAPVGSPQISILIPLHNHAALLPEAVASAVAALQVADLAGEILIVDDGSTDDSAAVAAALAAQHPGLVRTWSQPQAGQAAARQAAFLASSGEALVMLDADDLLEPRMLAEAWPLLVAHPAAAGVAGQAMLVGPDGRTELQGLRQQWAPWPRVLDYNPLGALAAVLVRRAAVERAGGLGFTGTPGCEDWDLWIRLARLSPHEPAIITSEALWSRYRQHPANYSRLPVPMLSAALEVLARCTAPDLRLATPPASQPVITPAALQRLGNQRVLHALGVLAAQPARIPTDGDAILARMALIQPSAALDVGFSCTLFQWGLEFALLAGPEAPAARRAWPLPEHLRLLERLAAKLVQHGCPPDAARRVQRECLRTVAAQSGRATSVVARLARLMKRRLLRRPPQTSLML